MDPVFRSNFGILFRVDFPLTALLSRSHHNATQFTHFQCTIQWLLVYSHHQFQNIFVTPKRSPLPVGHHPSSPPLPWTFPVHGIT